MIYDTTELNILKAQEQYQSKVEFGDMSLMFQSPLVHINEEHFPHPSLSLLAEKRNGG